MLYTATDVCAMIVFYNGESNLREKVAKLRNYVECVFIVDNGSKEEYKEVLYQIEEAQYAKIEYNEKNMGIAYALNQGVDYAYEHGYRLLLTLDQDSELDGDNIEKLANAINESEGVISVGPFYDGKLHTEDIDVRYLITSGNIILVDKVKELGGYDNKMFIDCVDIDFSFMLLSHGMAMKKVKNTVMIHKIGELEYTFNHRIAYLGHAPIRYFYKYRNNVYIYKKYFQKLPLDCLKLFMSLLIEFGKLLLIENNKKLKLKFAFLGIKQGLGVCQWSNDILIDQLKV